MKFASLVVPILLATTSWLPGADAFIVENGQPLAQIVIAEKPERSVRIAADDLQTYVKKITGAHLPIVTRPTDGKVKLFVGASPYTEQLGLSAEGLKCGAYRLVSGPDWLAFLGDNTDFVPVDPWARNHTAIADGTLQREWSKITGEKWGVPNAGMYKHRLRLPGHIGKPEGSVTDKKETFDSWAQDERGSFNAVCGWLHGLGVRWYMPGELGEVVPEMKTLALPKMDETVRPDFDMRRFSIRFSTVSSDTARWMMRLGTRDPAGVMVAHGCETMTGRDEIFAEHPDWFAMYGGKRRYQPGYSKNQLCYSNEELFQHTVRYCRAQFDQYDFEAVSVMPPDGYTAICQCPLCEGKDEPQRGSRGSTSNHVWDFVNRVAKEVAKTHPKKKIICCSYGCYSEPPTNIEKLEPNIQVVLVGGRRPKSSSTEQQEEIRVARQKWLKKTDLPIMIFENYPLTGRGWYLPAFVARTIGQSINETKGISAGEDIWLSVARDFETKDIGFNHFQVYFTARMYWGGKQQDVNAMLDEYCRLFYGPAGEAMRSFFAYCEDHWQEMENDKAKGDHALKLFAAAQALVSPSTKYAERLAHIDAFLQGLRKKNTLLSQKRGVVPKLRMVGEAKKIVIDGKLDDEYWQNCPGAATGRLRELQTGRSPALGTHVMSGWSNNSVYFAIRCDEVPGDKVVVSATKRDDPAIWYGDLIELLIATDMHSYYQIAVNPAGTIVDLDRGSDKATRASWESRAEVATSVADDHWCVEIRIPVTDDENDPLNQLVGKKPTQSLPWHINICRQRTRENGTEHSALSPTATGNFHDTMKFAHFYDGRSHQFEADPNVTDFITAFRSASTLSTEKKHSDSIAALLALIDGSQGKVTDVQKSAALKQAAHVARQMKDYDQAKMLASQIPLEAERKNANMQNLLAQHKHDELLELYGQEDLTKWPFWAASEGYISRARAYLAAGEKSKAERDLKSAFSINSDRRIRAEIQELLDKATQK